MKLLNQRKRLNTLIGISIGVLLLFIVVKHVNAECSDCVHFTNCALPTDSSGIVLVEPEVVMDHILFPDVDFSPEAGDEFAVYRPNDPLCVGAFVWSGPGSTAEALTVVGDSSITPEIEGIQPGEEMRWFAWDASADATYIAIVVYDPTPPFQPDGIYIPNGLYRLGELTPTYITQSRAGQMGIRSEMANVVVFAMLSIVTIGTLSWYRNRLE